MSLRNNLARLCASVGIAIVVMGCAGKRYDPWRIAPERFSSTVHTLAMLPVGVPTELSGSPPVSMVLDSLVTSALRDAGYAVIPSDSAGLIWQRLVDSAGGFFDSRSGELDETKQHTLKARLWEAVQEHHYVDALVFPAVIPVAAKFSNSTAKWDGTSQKIEGFGGALVRGLFGERRSGTTAAVSLLIVVEADGRVLYMNQGGIQVVIKPKGGVTEGWDRVPRSELFRDRERVTKAARIALEPLVGKPRE